MYSFRPLRYVHNASSTTVELLELFDRSVTVSGWKENWSKEVKGIVWLIEELIRLGVNLDGRSKSTSVLRA